MNISSILYIDRYLKLDLHGYDRETASLAVKDFISDAIKMKEEIVVIVHGIGSGIIRDTVIKTLMKNKMVEDFGISYQNPGCTVVKLKKQNLK